MVIPAYNEEEKTLIFFTDYVEYVNFGQRKLQNYWLNYMQEDKNQILFDFKEKLYEEDCNYTSI